MLLWLFISWALCGQTRRQGLLLCECPFGPAYYSQYLTQHLFIYRLIIQTKTLAGDKRDTANKYTGGNTQDFPGQSGAYSHPSDIVTLRLFYGNHTYCISSLLLL